MSEARFEKLRDEMKKHWKRAERAIPQDPHGMVEDMNERAHIMARVNHIIPEARTLLAQARADAIGRLLRNGGLSKEVLKLATLVKPMIEGEVSAYQQLVDDAERCSATLVHQCDVLRTDVSNEKQYLATFGGSKQRDGRAEVDTTTGEIHTRKSPFNQPNNPNP